MNIKHWDNSKHTGHVSDTSTLAVTVILPVQPEGMKECRQTLHHQEDGHSENSKQAKHRHQEQNPETGVHSQSNSHHHGPQHLW